jgi:hypothetical protein
LEGLQHRNCSFFWDIDVLQVEEGGLWRRQDILQNKVRRKDLRRNLKTTDNNFIITNVVWSSNPV